MRVCATTCFILLFSLGSHFLGGQDFKKDMKMINAALKPLKKYAVNLHYRMYLDNQLNTPYQEKTVEIKKDGINSLCKHRTAELISNNEMSVYVDHQFKNMMIMQQQDAPMDEYLEFTNYMEDHFDSLMYMYEKIEFKDLGNNINEYKCQLVAGKYSRIDIRFNRKSARINSITFYYRGKIQIDKIDQKSHALVMRIDYENFNTNPVFKPGSFSTSRYLVKTGKNAYAPSINYKGYKIYDNNTLE
ncbi:MAG: hypothetical protein K0S33_791 [Bacteroidetes bacterium]|jgi:hypothetical protein|nr:hypothetical protein [Bacteroidota bacterium]